MVRNDSEERATNNSINRQGICFFLMILIIFQSCTTWQKTPISIKEAVDIGSVKISYGTPVDLNEAVDKGKVIVKKKNQTQKEYDDVIFYNNQYHGTTEPAKFELLDPDSILVVIPIKSLRVKEYKEVSYTDGQYYGMFHSQELLDTQAIQKIQKKGENSDDPNAGAVLAMVTIIYVGLSLAVIAAGIFLLKAIFSGGI